MILTAIIKIFRVAFLPSNIAAEMMIKAKNIINKIAMIYLAKRRYLNRLISIFCHMIK